MKLVDEKKHQAWHTLFQNWEADRIVEEINFNWIDPRYRLEVHRIR